MNCYFCNKECYHYSSNIHFECYDCKDKYNLYMVLTTYIDGVDLTYAHFYIKLKNNIKYHIRLHLRENRTVVADDKTKFLGAPPLLNLNGFPITPENVKQKLPTYLTFS